MSDDPFSLPLTPLLTPEKARDVGRAYKALAEQFREIGVQAETRRAERDSQRWLTYSIALAQTPPPEQSPNKSRRLN